MTALLRLAAWYCCLLVMCDTMTAESDPSTAWQLEPDAPWPTAPPLPTPAPTGLPPASGGEAAPVRAWLPITALITAYQPDVDCAVDAAGRPTHRTSIRRSTDTHPYGIAADPSFLPYGAGIMVPDYLDRLYPGRAWQVDDTGGALRHDGSAHGVVHIDLRYRTIWSAMKTGRRWAEVLVEVTGWSDAAVARLRRASQTAERMKQRGEMP